MLEIIEEDYNLIQIIIIYIMDTNTDYTTKLIQKWLKVIYLNIIIQSFILESF